MKLLKISFAFILACMLNTASYAQLDDFVRIMGHDTIGGPFGVFDGPVIKSATHYYTTVISDKDYLNKTFLIKTDHDFNPVWAKKFISPSGSYTRFAVAHSAGSLYFSTNGLVLNPTGYVTLAVFKVDSAGNKQFARTYWKQQTSTPGINTTGLIECNDGNLLLAASKSLTSNGVYIKINPVDGQIIWSTEIPGVRSSGKIVQDPQGNFYLNCYYSSPSKPALLKISNDGIPVYCKLFDIPGWQLTSTSIHYTANQTVKMFGNVSISTPQSLDQYVLNIDTSGNLLSQKKFSTNFPDTVIYSRDILREDSTGFTYSGIYPLGSGYASYAIWQTDLNDSVISTKFYRDSLFTSSQEHEYFNNPDGSLDLFSYTTDYSSTAQQSIYGVLVRRIPSSFNSVCGGDPGTVFTQPVQPPIQSSDLNLNPQYSQYITDTAGLSGYYFVNDTTHNYITCNDPLTTQELPLNPATLYYNSGMLYSSQEKINGRLLEIFDPLGRRILYSVNPLRNGPVSVEALDPGIYVGVLYLEDGTRSVLKFFKE